jgi:acetolactate synthase small subunit
MPDVETTGERWAFVLKVQDRPGALAAISNAFSARGVSLETALGCGTETQNGALPSGQADGQTMPEPMEPRGGTVVLGFRATERKRGMLLRVLQRLSHVVEVQSYPYSSPELRVIAVVRVAASAGGPWPEGVHVERVGATEADQTLMVAGPAEAVDAALDALRAGGVLLEAVRSVIAV